MNYLLLNDDLICETVLRFEGYRGIAERMKLSKDKEEDYSNEILKDRFEDVTIDYFKISHVDVINVPLVISLFYRIHNYSQTAGNIVYLTPVLIHRLQSNPFKLEKRKFPVDYNYRLAPMENVTLTVPESYRVIEKRKLINLNCQNLQFVTSYNVEGNNVEVKRFFLLNKDFVRPREYPELRNQYEQIVSWDQCQLVLAKPE